MNPEKLKKLQAQTPEVRIGGKGMPRRKKKVVHVSAATDNKKLQSTLKKLAVNSIPGIEEVNLIKSDGSVIHFNNPRTQASLASNVFAITGQTETKNIAEMLPGIINHLGSDGLAHLKRLAATVRPTPTHDDDSDIPELVTSFENAMNSGDAAPAPGVDPEVWKEIKLLQSEKEEATTAEVNVDEAIESKKKEPPTEAVD